MIFKSDFKKEDINNLPLIKFEGKIVVIVNEEQLEESLREVYKYPNVGFDTESKPAFKRGEYNPIALIQIAIPDKVFLIRVNVIGLTDSLLDFLEDANVQKVGIGLRDDLTDLKKIIDFVPAGFVDLSKVAGELGIKHVGVRNLSAILLEGRISKSQQTSNWERDILSEGQLKYAATDAWVCLEIHNLLSEKGYI